MRRTVCGPRVHACRTGRQSCAALSPSVRVSVGVSLCVCVFPTHLFYVCNRSVPAYNVALDVGSFLGNSRPWNCMWEVKLGEKWRRKILIYLCSLAASTGYSVVSEETPRCAFSICRKASGAEVSVESAASAPKSSEAEIRPVWFTSTPGPSLVTCGKSARCRQSALTAQSITKFFWKASGMFQQGSGLDPSSVSNHWAGCMFSCMMGCIFMTLLQWPAWSIPKWETPATMT